jgi:hypothetical protein
VELTATLFPSSLHLNEWLFQVEPTSTFTHYICVVILKTSFGNCKGYWGWKLFWPKKIKSIYCLNEDLKMDAYLHTWICYICENTGYMPCCDTLIFILNVLPAIFIEALSIAVNLITVISLFKIFCSEFLQNKFCELDWTWGRCSTYFETKEKYVQRTNDRKDYFLTEKISMTKWKGKSFNSRHCRHHFGCCQKPVC